MEFRTIVDIPSSSWKIKPTDRLLFVGSCFADRIGHRFVDEHFETLVNPYGVMYNPASVLHTVKKVVEEPNTSFNVAFFTLGTNHVYILNETGEIVDNCNKRPQRLFTERELTIAECVTYLSEAVECLRETNPDVRVVMTVSPIRYRKYGYHESQLSKSTLLLAVNELLHQECFHDVVSYFPAYEIMMDELRDYRFYEPDMLHPSAQAVEFIWQRLAESYFGEDTLRFMEEWKPIREALAHKPFHPESAEYQAFRAKAEGLLKDFESKYNLSPLA